jgi:hypothetical protein
MKITHNAMILPYIALFLLALKLKPNHFCTVRQPHGNLVLKSPHL